VIGALLSFVAAASASGAPATPVVARFDCQVRGERNASPQAHREFISLRAWEATDGASIERQYDGYGVDDAGSTRLYPNEPGRFVVEISNGSLILTLDRIEDGSGRFFNYGSSVMSHHNYLSTYRGFCSSEIIQAPPPPLPPKGNNR